MFCTNFRLGFSKPSNSHIRDRVDTISNKSDCAAQTYETENEQRRQNDSSEKVKPQSDKKQILLNGVTLVMEAAPDGGWLRDDLVWWS